MKKFLILLLILFLSWINVKSYFHSGFPYTHDGENHLARFANYKVAFREGQIPPRFAPNLFNHYGYPVLNYNYPLANILALPFSLLKISYEVSFKMIAVSFVMAGILGIYCWVWQLSKSSASAIWSTILYASTPFVVSTLIFRGNIGEIMALGLIPWILWLIEKIKTGALNNLGWLWLTAVIIVTAFSLSHNVSFVFGLPLILFFSLIRLKLNKKFWLVLISIFAGGAILSAWFWIPALLEQSEIVVGNANLSKAYAEHFVTLSQILFSPLQFGFSWPGPIDTLSFNLGWTQNLVLILASLSLLKHLFIFRSLKIFPKWWLILLTGCWLLFLLQFQITQPLWSIFPFLRFIQFPWRLELFFTIAVAGLAGIFLTKLPKLPQLLIAVIISIQIFTITKVRPVDYFHKSNETYEAFGQSTSTANENLPKSWGYLDIGDWQPGPKILTGDAAIQVQYWKGSGRLYKLIVNSPSVIIEPTMNFLGWETAIVNQKNEKIAYLNSETIKGRIAYQIEPGEYTIRTRFTQHTLPRMIGNTTSLVGLVGLGLIFISNLIRPKHV